LFAFDRFHNLQERNSFRRPREKNSTLDTAFRGYEALARELIDNLGQIGLGNPRGPGNLANAAKASLPLGDNTQGMNGITGRLREAHHKLQKLLCSNKGQRCPQCKNQPPATEEFRCANMGSAQYTFA
jgi:hypothetical protein